MMSFTWRRLVGTALIFIPAFFAILGIAAVAIEVYHVRPKYAGQMAVYTLLGVVIAAWKYGEDAFSFFAAAAERIPRWARLAIAAFVGWSAAVLLFVWTFEPFELYSNIDSPGWLMVAKIIVFPWVLAAIFGGLYKWVAKK